MKIDLDKNECEFLSAAMTEAITQADEEIGRTARTASNEEKEYNLHLRGIFSGIKTKMDNAIGEVVSDEKA